MTPILSHHRTYGADRVKRAIALPPRQTRQADFPHPAFLQRSLKGYDYSAVRIPIKKAEKIPVIPRRANAIFPGLQDAYKPYYRTRSAIERFFGRIKENKRLALRFDKLTHTFFSFFALAAIKSLGLIC